MRFIPLTKLLKEIFADVDGAVARQRLFRALKKSARMDPALRYDHCKRNGHNKWSPLKNRLTAKLGNKCWYTEAELIGGHLAMDHYRPFIAYWWLAYDAENFRVACPFANSPEHNKEHGSAGGKGDNFPLLSPGVRARGKSRLFLEKPVILDPCRQEDCDLLAFQADGRPILNPNKVGDPVAAERVEQSKLFLNLDHPDFNSKREQLYHDITDDVKVHERLPATAAEREIIRKRMKVRLASTSAFSTAARYYLQFHRHHPWVEDLLKEAAKSI